METLQLQGINRWSPLDSLRDGTDIYVGSRKASYSIRHTRRNSDAHTRYYKGGIDPAYLHIENDRYVLASDPCKVDNLVWRDDVKTVELVNEFHTPDASDVLRHVLRLPKGRERQGVGAFFPWSELARPIKVWLYKKVY